MPKPEKGDFQKHTLHLFRGDFEKLQEAYPETGAASVVRRLIHNHLEKIKVNPPIHKIKTGDMNV